MDPRGVGASTPIRCGLPVFPAHLTLFPRTAREFERLHDYGARLGRSCLRRSGPLVGHVDTLSVARDHEALRRALGVQRVSWLGISYGTQVAANYAALFPHRTRAMVLDGALEHSGSEVSMLSDRGAHRRGLLRPLRRLVRHRGHLCAARARTWERCTTPWWPARTGTPSPCGARCAPVTGEDIRMQTPAGLLFKEPTLFGPDRSWAGLSRGIKAAVEGDASMFALPPPRAAVTLAERLAVGCMDYVSEVHTWAQMQQRWSWADGSRRTCRAPRSSGTCCGASAGRSRRPTPSAGSTCAGSPR